jgi:DNA-directed RNA polymerase subunit RPC12/RpoP
MEVKMYENWEEMEKEAAKLAVIKAKRRAEWEKRLALQNTNEEDEQAHREIIKTECLSRMGVYRLKAEQNRINRIKQMRLEKNLPLDRHLTQNEKKIRIHPNYEKKIQIYTNYKKWKKNNPDRIREYRKRFLLKHPDYFKERYLNTKEKIREWAVKHSYGLTLKQVEALKNIQNNKCAICQHKLKNGHAVHIDHNHKTQKTRGILCASCNLGLGYFKDNPQLLKLARIYLQRHAGKK